MFGSLHYQDADDAYREARLLNRVARVRSLWALGVCAAISGAFVGWHFGLEEGGFGGLLIATALIARAVADARDRGAGEVLIGAAEGPDPVPRRLYASLGFRPVCITDEYTRHLQPAESLV